MNFNAKIVQPVAWEEEFLSDIDLGWALALGEGLKILGLHMTPGDLMGLELHPDPVCLRLRGLLSASKYNPHLMPFLLSLFHIKQ